MKHTLKHENIFLQNISYIIVIINKHYYKRFTICHKYIKLLHFYWIYKKIPVSFISGENWNTRGEKTIDLSQITDKLYHIMLYRVHLRKNFYRKCNFSRKIKICRKIIFVKRT
jgi:hypothetical protein